MIKPEEIFFIQNIKIHHLQVKQNLKGGKSKSRGANAPPTPLKEFVSHVPFVPHVPVVPCVPHVQHVPVPHTINISLIFYISVYFVILI